MSATQTSLKTPEEGIEIDGFEMGTALFLVDKLLRHSVRQFRDPRGVCRSVQITVGSVIVLRPEPPIENWRRQVVGSTPHSRNWTRETWDEIERAFDTLTTRELELDLGRVHKVYEVQGAGVEEVIVELYDLLLKLVRGRHDQRGHSAQDSNRRIREVCLRA